MPDDIKTLKSSAGAQAQDMTGESRQHRPMADTSVTAFVWTVSGIALAACIGGSGSGVGGGGAGLPRTVRVQVEGGPSADIILPENQDGSETALKITGDADAFTIKQEQEDGTVLTDLKARVLSVESNVMGNIAPTDHADFVASVTASETERTVALISTTEGYDYDVATTDGEAPYYRVTIEFSGTVDGIATEEPITRTVTVTIGDENDVAPMLTVQGTGSVNENQADPTDGIDTGITVTVSDPDTADTSFEADDFTIEIDGARTTDYRMKPVEGNGKQFELLYIGTGYDYEDSTQRQITLSISVKDAADTPSAPQIATININPRNDEPPSISFAGGSTASVDENLDHSGEGNARFLGVVIEVDDADTEDGFTWRVTDSADPTGTTSSPNFAVKENSARNGRYELAYIGTGFDYEVDTVTRTLTIIANDGVSDSPNPLTATVTIADENEPVKVFTALARNPASFGETKGDTQTDRVVLQDEDGAAGFDLAHFEVVLVNDQGVVDPNAPSSVASAISIEQDATYTTTDLDKYAFIVKIGWIDLERLGLAVAPDSFTQKVRIDYNDGVNAPVPVANFDLTVTNENDERPAIFPVFGQEANSVPEHADHSGDGNELALNIFIDVDDADPVSLNTFTWTVTEDGSASTNFKVSENPVPNGRYQAGRYELLYIGDGQTGFDYETPADRVKTVRVSVNDGVSNSNNSLDFRVEVSDENDVAPTLAVTSENPPNPFIHGQYPEGTRGDVTPFDTGIVVTVTDPDTEDARFEVTDFTRMVVEGVDSNEYRMEAFGDDGKQFKLIYTGTGHDYEVASQRRIVVEPTITDKAGNPSANLKILINTDPVNDEPLQFAQTEYAFTLSSGVTGTEAIPFPTAVTASDRDVDDSLKPAKITYELLNNNPAQTGYAIDENTGVITYTPSPDRMLDADTSDVTLTVEATSNLEADPVTVQVKIDVVQEQIEGPSSTEPPSHVDIL